MAWRGARLGRAYTDYQARAASLQASETQVQLLLARYCLATRLNCLARYLPSAISQSALRIVDDLLVATVAGCAGEDSATNLTAATQGRALLTMRYGGVLPGAVTTAPAQHVSSVVAVERFISEIGAALEQRGIEPSALGSTPTKELAAAPPRPSKRAPRAAAAAAASLDGPEDALLSAPAAAEAPPAHAVRASALAKERP